MIFTDVNVQKLMVRESKSTMVGQKKGSFVYEILFAHYFDLYILG